jgi:hypothetical protein
MTKMYERMRERFYWKKISRDVRKWVGGCLTCQSRKPPQPKNQGRLKPFSLENVGPFEHVSIDFFGPFPTTERGNSVVLCMVDHATRWGEAVPLPNQKAPTVADAIYRYWICRHGLFMVLHSDNSKNLAGEVMKELSTRLRFTHTFSPEYHPQSNAFVERFNRFLGDAITAYIQDTHQNWDLVLDPILFAYRTSVHLITGETPFYMAYIRDARLPVDVLSGGTTGQARTRTQGNSVVELMSKAYARVRERMEKLARSRKLIFDQKTKDIAFELGNIVLVFYEEHHRPGQSTKLISRWIGPYRIQEIREFAQWGIFP